MNCANSTINNLKNFLIFCESKMVWVRKVRRFHPTTGLWHTDYETKTGKLHRNGDKPARIWEDGRKEWFKNDERHRDGDSPAIDEFNDDGTFLREYYFQGQLHRDNDLPAVVRYDGNTRTREYLTLGVRHRVGRPAYFELHKDSGIVEKRWYFHGFLHREDGPAVEMTHPSGAKVEEWFLNGKRHRENGLPAYVCTDGDGDISEQYYYCHGVKYECISFWGITLSWTTVQSK